AAFALRGTRFLDPDDFQSPSNQWVQALQHLRAVMNNHVRLIRPIQGYLQDSIVVVRHLLF
ncbi:MAG: hypothetical protein P4L87_12730, partial [Formivibrio sp.]|nr:hypothetical protein [Formivibrio sp.]